MDKDPRVSVNATGGLATFLVVTSAVGVITIFRKAYKAVKGSLETR